MKNFDHLRKQRVTGYTASLTANHDKSQYIYHLKQRQFTRKTCNTKDLVVQWFLSPLSLRGIVRFVTIRF